MKKRRVNRAKRAIAQPRFRSRIETPAKGLGAYRRKPKHTPQQEGKD